MTLSTGFCGTGLHLRLETMLLIGILVAVVLSSCSEKPPIPEKEFAEIYVQLQLFDAQYAAQPSVQKAKVDSLLKAFKVDKNLIDSTLSWYSRNPERWNKFFADVQTRMNKIRTAYLRKSH